MAANTRYGPIHANNNVICAVEVVQWGELGSPVEVAFYPLDHSFRPNHRFKHFHLKMKPDFPNDETELKKAHQKVYTEAAYDSLAGYSLFELWVEKDLELKNRKRLQPLVWDWATVRPVLKRWMGDCGFEHHIMDTPRDLMTLLNFVNDRHDRWGETVPYVHPTKNQLFNRSGVKLIDDGLTASALGLAEVYSLMLSQRFPGYNFDKLG